MIAMFTCSVVRHGTDLLGYLLTGGSPDALAVLVRDVPIPGAAGFGAVFDRVGGVRLVRFVVSDDGVTCRADVAGKITILDVVDRVRQDPRFGRASEVRQANVAISLVKDEIENWIEEGWVLDVVGVEDVNETIAFSIAGVCP